MTPVSSLLSLRKAAKKHLPDFLVKESKYSARIKSRWRYPQGRHSKVRQCHLGRPALPTPGYGSPKVVRGLHSSGFKPVIVHSVKDLQLLNKEKEGGVFSGTVGDRKKLQLLKYAVEHKIKLLNVRDPVKLSEKITAKITERQKLKRQKLVVRTEKQKEKERKVEEKKKKEAATDKAIEDTVTDDSVIPESEKQKKQQEQQEMEKTIIKRQ